MSELYLWQPELLVLCLAEDPLLLGVLQELEIHSHIPPLNVEHEVKIKGGGTFVNVKNIQYCYIHFQGEDFTLGIFFGRRFFLIYDYQNPSLQL